LVESIHPPIIVNRRIANSERDSVDAVLRFTFLASCSDNQMCS